MKHFARPAHFVAAFLVVAIAAGSVVAQSAEEADADRTAIAAAIDAFVQAFNAHDATALGRLWRETAVHRSPMTGRELRGRAAIVAGYVDLFRRDPRSKLTVDVDSLQLAAPDKASLLAVATVEHGAHAASRSRFRAVLSRTGGTWLIDAVDEIDLPPEAAAALSPLGWLVGTWADDAPTGRVVNKFHWAPGNSFLVRSYTREPARAAEQAAPAAPGFVLQGTQIIGWDGEQLCLRTWLFDSTGSFGEGYWQPAGESRWVNKLVVKLPDGRRGSLTQVLAKLADDKLSFQAIDRELDGEALPNGPLAIMTRAAERAESPTPAPGETP